MPLLIPIEDIVAGDYSTEHGTVAKVIKTEKSDSVELIFMNGKSISPAKGTELEFLQGGRFDRPVDPNTKHKN